MLGRMIYSTILVVWYLAWPVLVFIGVLYVLYGIALLIN
jgi:uncharacterized membrane protein